MVAVTQADISRQLGISQCAVGYALSDSPRYRHKLRPETRQKVIETANRLGYRPHRHAQVMRMRKSGVIGMIHSSSFTQVLVERSLFVAQAIRKSGYQFLAGDVSWYNEGLRTACDTMIGERVEGVLVSGLGPEQSGAELKRVQDAGIPVVIVGGVHFPGIPRVTADYEQGMTDLTQHLITLGYRRLTFLVHGLARPSAEKPVTGTAVQRVQAFQAATAAAGLTEAEVVYQPTAMGPDEMYEPGRLATHQILSRSQRPEALICSNDCWAVGAFKACADAGVRVPQDIAIAGFDNSNFSGFMPAALTTVAQPSEAMAKKAVEMLMALVRGEKPSAGEQLVKIPCRLVVRESCGVKLRQRG